MAPRRVRVFVVPYDSGVRDYRMGAGPSHLIELGIARHLEQLGCDVSVEEIHPDGSPPHAEIAAAFSLARKLSEGVRGAIAAGEFPLVLSGNCSTSLGTVSGLAPDSRGVVWFDAHGDFNTPETTRSGFLDGMALAALTGRCWHALAHTIPGFAAVSDSNVVQLGARNFDSAESELLNASGIERASADSSSDKIDALISGLANRLEGTYLHVDLDVIDAGDGKANTYACAGGYTRDDLLSLLERIAQRISVKAVAITAYDPRADSDGRIAEAAMRIAAAVVTAQAHPARS